MNRWVKALVSAVVLALLFVLLPWSQIWEAGQQVSSSLWVGVLGGFLVGHFIGVLKWRMIININAAGAPLSMLGALRCYTAGLFANLYLPSIVGGDVLRAVLAGKETGRPEAVILGGIADRLIDIVALSLLIGAGGVLVGSAASGFSPFLITLVGILGTGFTVLVVLRRPLKQWPPQYRRRIGRSLVALRRLRRRPGTALAALLLAAVLQCCFVLLNAWIGYAVGIEVALGVWFFAWPLAKVAALLPISLNGLGVRDAALAALLVPFGATAALGVVASLVWQTVVYAGGLLGGLAWWMLSRQGIEGWHERLLAHSSEK